MKIEKNYIYVLYDPREPDNYRYIGFTNNIQKRFTGHLSEVNRYNKNIEWFKTYKINWINSLLNIGLKPEIKIIEEFECDIKTISEKEIYYYNIFLNEGHKLTNTAEPGFGGNTIANMTMEQQLIRNKKISDTEKGRIFSEYTRNKISEKGKGRKHSKETIEKSRLSKIGKKQSNETIEKRIKHLKKIVFSYDLNDNFSLKEYESIKNASIEYKVSYNRISFYCKNNKIYKKYLWSLIPLDKEKIIELVEGYNL